MRLPKWNLSELFPERVMNTVRQNSLIIHLGGGQILPHSNSVTLAFSSLRWGLWYLSLGLFSPLIKCNNGKITAFIMTYSAVYYHLVSALLHSTDCFRQGCQPPLCWKSHFSFTWWSFDTYTRPSSVKYSLPWFLVTLVSKFSDLWPPL